MSIHPSAYTLANQAVLRGLFEGELLTNGPYPFPVVNLLTGECWHEVVRLSRRGRRAYAALALGLPTDEVPCPSPSCAGGILQDHPIGDSFACKVCRCTGVVATPTVATVMAGVRSQVAA